MTTTMTGGEAVAATLAAVGVRHVFGIVSVHNLPMYEALSRRTDVEVVKVRHEQGAAHAADAYFRATGEMAAVLTSTGPGAANAVAGLYEAGFASSRVLMVTGQAESRFYGKAKGFLHENERQVEMLRSVCRAVASVRQSEQIPTEIMRVAADICTGRPQPGAVEVPIDLQYRRAEVHVPDWSPPAPVAPDADVLDDAAARLAGAVRPLVWAGGGVNIAGAADELTELAERLGAPVVTTIEGRGAIAEDHPLSLGFCSDRGPMADVFDEADLLLAVGTRFQNYATRVWSLRLPEELLHLDVDPAVIGLNYPASLPIVADAKAGLRGLLDRLPEAGGAGAGGADSGFVDRARKIAAAEAEQVRTEIGVDHSAVCDTIRRLLPADGRIVRDSTVPAYTWGNRLLPILRSRTSIRPGAVAIGPGVPMGIGAAVGSGAPTVVIQGDGGLLLSLGELSACAEHGLPVIVLVFNDAGYGVLRVIQDAVFDEHHGTDLPRTDFVAVAEAMGVAAEAVGSAAEFEAAFGRAVERA
ncbi:MAG TPA: thiamine pyrophosphate-binding protein, partial [Acidimicrobiaceae bacterium]|nr:thiamine pyrophosphate-binding protein [Acidimicrobiaceae bacterium]